MKRALAIIGAVVGFGLLIGLAATPVAGAAKQRAKSEVTAQPPEKGSPVHGRVKSVEACEGGRRVQIIEKNESGMRRVYATTKTNRQGRYEFEQMLFNATSTYWVEAKLRERKRVICKADRSPNFYEPAD